MWHKAHPALSHFPAGWPFGFPEGTQSILEIFPKQLRRGFVFSKIKCAAHKALGTHITQWEQHIYTLFTHTHVQMHDIYTLTHNICRWNRHRWITQLSLTHTHTHGGGVGGPALHVPHSGISVSLSQSEIVSTGLSPERSGFAACTVVSAFEPYIPALMADEVHVFTVEVHVFTTR